MIKENKQLRFTEWQVKNIIWEVLDYYKIQDSSAFAFDFEARLNDRWLSGNNWENEHLLEKYQEDLAEWFIYNSD